MMEPRELWWGQVPAPVSQFNQIAYDLREGHSLVLDAGRMFWVDLMCEYLRQVVTEIDNAMPFERIDASSCPPDMLPDAFLFSCIGEEDRYGTQLLRTMMLRNKPACLWVTGIPPAQYEAWIQMTAELMQEPSRMLLILDIPEHVRVPQCERLASMGVWHSRFDVYYFALMQLSGMATDERRLEYAATLATELSGLDPVRCTQLCSVAEQLMQNPIHVADKLGCDVNSMQAVLRAQMRSFMPLVELCRMTLIDLLRHQLENALPFRSDMGQTIGANEVDRVELTHMIQMSNRGRIKLHSDLYGQIYNLREIRNQMAHLKMLSNSDINMLLSIMDDLAQWQ